MAGMTDYTGVPLEDILAHLDDWATNTSASLEALALCKQAVEREPALYQNPVEVLSYIAYFSDLLQRYLADFQRLRRELPACVTDAHIETVSQLYSSAKSETALAIEFKRDWISHALPHEEVRRTLDKVYGETRGQCTDMLDLSNVIPRLRALRSAPVSPEALTDLHLKPNVFGIGINFNRVLGRVRTWWRARRARRV